jgi:pantoate--beta-alanine ligase
VRTVRSIAEVRALVAAARDAGRSVGLVPTMGAFHAGHEALIRSARERCDEVVVSLFVNPAQFDDAADLAAYPRSEASDAATAARFGVDVLFAPPPEEIYPDGFSTQVAVQGLSTVLEGAERGAGHFAGVCTVVCKLFNIVAPDVAFFGQKDAQQVTVVRRMVRDLDLPVTLHVVPTVRVAHGLALSSRNVRLGAVDRARALSLHRGLDAARALAAAGEQDAAILHAAAAGALRDAGVEPDYLAFVDPDTLQPVERVDRRILVAVAARVGPTRLIDNVLIDPAQVATPAVGPSHPG